MFKKGEEVKKIVLLLSSPFNQKDKERFGVECLAQNGFEVEVWDFTPFLNPWRWQRSQLFNNSTCEIYRIFSDQRTAFASISGLRKDCLIVCIINFAYETCSLYRIISKCDVRYCLISYNYISFDMKPNRNIFKRLASVSFQKLRGYLFLKIPYKFLCVSPAAIVLMLGGKLDLAGLPVDSATRIVRSHYFDYDIYLKELQKPVEGKERIAVFLDNFIPFHPDWGSAGNLDPVEYYALLCKFFDLLEKKYGVRIVIAAHPRSTYEELPDYFNGRAVIKDRTVELVRHSEFVVVHHSASISFAVLFSKPLVFITTDKLHQTEVAKIIDFMALAFNKTPINLDQDLKENMDEELIVDESVYQKYVATYIKPKGTEDLPIWQAFSNDLKNINGLK